MTKMIPRLIISMASAPHDAQSNDHARQLGRICSEAKSLAPHFEEDFAWLLDNTELLERYKECWVAIHRKQLLAVAQSADDAYAKARQDVRYMGDYDLVIAYVNQHAAVASFYLPDVYTVAMQIMEADHEWIREEPQIQLNYVNRILAVYRKQVLGEGANFEQAREKAKEHANFPTDTDLQDLVSLIPVNC